MKKIFLLQMVAGILTIIFLIIGISYLFNVGGDAIDSYNRKDELYKSHLNESYRLDDKQYKIINYSIANETYTLSNGTIINSYLINDNE